MSIAAAEKVIASKAPNIAKVAEATPKPASPKPNYHKHVKKAVDTFLPQSKSKMTSTDRVFPYVLLIAGGVMLYSSVKGLNPVQVLKNALKGKPLDENAKLSGSSSGALVNPATDTSAGKPANATKADGRYEEEPAGSGKYKWYTMYKPGDPNLPKDAPPKPTNINPPINAPHELRYNPHNHHWVEFDPTDDKNVTLGVPAPSNTPVPQ